MAGLMERGAVVSLALSCMMADSLYAAATLGIADLLASGPDVSDVRQKSTPRRRQDQ
jgi:hypothetical protein